MSVCVSSDKGNVREVNQDTYFYDEDNKLPIYIVADGMGGHKAGEIASKLAVSTIKDLYEKERESILKGEMQLVKFIRNSLKLANEKVLAKSSKDEKLEGMGTTLTMAIIFEDEIHVGHVGDSRGYIFRDNQLIQITHDHSLVYELVKEGSISKEEALTHPQKNIITRAVGTNNELCVDIFTEKIEKNDIFILCTDGLTNMVSEERIKDVITNNEINKTCSILTNISNELGGTDNTTVMIISL